METLKESKGGCFTFLLLITESRDRRELLLGETRGQAPAESEFDLFCIGAPGVDHRVRR